MALNTPDFNNYHSYVSEVNTVIKFITSKFESDVSEQDKAKHNQWDLRNRIMKH